MRSKTLLPAFSVFLFVLSLAFTQQIFAENRSILSSASGTSVHVMEFEIDGSSHWNLLRETTIPAFGTVEYTALTTPDSKNNMNVYYTFRNAQGNLQLANIRFDYANFDVINHKSFSAKFGSNSFVGTHGTSNPKKNRIGFLNDSESFTSHKVRSSGKPAKKQDTLFGDEPGMDFVTGSFSADGHVASQIQVDSASGRTFLDLQNMDGAGKKNGGPVRLELSGDAVNLSLSSSFGDHFFVVVRSLSGSSKTGLFLTRFDNGSNQPGSSPITVKGFKKTKFLNELALGTTFIFQNFVISGQDDSSCDKVTARVREFNQDTGKPVGKEQTIIGCSSAALQTGPVVYGFSAVGFSVAPSNPLTVSCSANKTSGTAPLSVDFKSTVSGGSGNYSWNWDFDDGGHSSQEDVTHVYQTSRTYHPSLLVTDRDTGEDAPCTPVSKIDVGTGAQPEITVTPLTSTTITCGTDTATIEIRNDGQADLQLNSIQILNNTDQCLLFNLSNGCPSSLGPGLPCDVSITCADNCGGSNVTKPLEIRSNDQDEKIKTVDINGQG